MKLAKKLLQGLASLRLTVILLTLAMILIFMGTLAQARMGIWEAVETYFRSMLVYIDLQLLVPRSVARIPYRMAFPGGMLIGSAMFVTLIAAHVARFKMSRRRIGVVTLHAGLIVLIAGEFVTANFSDEGIMAIDVGSSSRYVEDLRATELAVIDFSDPETDTVVSIPQQIVSSASGTQQQITDQALPFNIEVLTWMDNARLLNATSPTRADQGVGRNAVADALPPVRGVDGGQVDMPAAYVRLVRDGQPLGTWLVAAQLMDSQPVTIDGRTYGISLRHRRTYKPYEMHLLEFNHDKFVGTEIAKNFSSRVRIVDPEAGTNREVLIWMNNPLRYRGETFYQSSYKPDGSGSVLQVVRNPGAVLPYIACVLTGGGMTLHFGMSLFGFLRRRNKNKPVATQEQPTPATPAWRRALPWAVGAVGVIIACSAILKAPPATDYNLQTFARLPVSSGGRVKPMDSAARHALMIAGGRQSVRTEDGEINATQFLIDLMARPEAVKDLPVVRVDHPDVLAMLGLAPEDGGRISLAKIEPHWESIREQAALAQEVDSKKRDPFQRGILGLYGGVSNLLAHAQMQAPYAVPPLAEGEQWRPFFEAMLDSGAHLDPNVAPDFSKFHPAVSYYIAMMTAYSEQDPEAFNSAVAGYDKLLHEKMPHVMRKTNIEVLFERAAPFLGATTVYLIAFMLICLSLLMRLRSTKFDDKTSLVEGLRVSAFGLLIGALLVHTVAIALRIYLQGRPPVTNLYSSAVFVGWAAVLLGIILERLFPLGMAALGSAVIGFATLIIAHNLGNDGDTMQMMQAVLDSNFWLATHVITIALGYSTTFLAGALAGVYLILGVFTRRLTPARSEALAKMVYAIVCFSLLLSFVGTVLGGIWADQSWGRFWGWDPKENGAALVVLINAIILHARWGGLIKHRGMMVLAVGGNIVTAWSWFGTNMLGVGLHSYGFMDSAVFWLIAFVASQLLIMFFGLLPFEAWRSYSKPQHQLPQETPSEENALS